ncbi:hypothetical protein ACJX0J_011273, partial [Zea mays]
FSKKWCDRGRICEALLLVFDMCYFLGLDKLNKYILDLLIYFDTEGGMELGGLSSISSTMLLITKTLIEILLLVCYLDSTYDDFLSKIMLERTIGQLKKHQSVHKIEIYILMYTPVYGLGFHIDTLWHGAALFFSIIV